VKRFVLKIDLNMGQHNGRPLWSAATSQNGVQLQGKFVTDHSLRRSHPCIQVVGVLLVHGEKVADLRAVSMGDDNAPIHFEQVDDVAHDFSEHLGCICTPLSRGLESVAPEGIDGCLPHRLTSS
jgi:hypothetical protein